MLFDFTSEETRFYTEFSIWSIEAVFGNLWIIVLMSVSLIEAKFVLCRGLVRKYSQVIQRYYAQYLSGYDAIALDQAIQVKTRTTTRVIPRSLAFGRRQ